MTYSAKSIITLQGISFLFSMIFLHTLHANANEVELRKQLFHERPYDQKVCPEEGITTVYTNLILLQIESVNEKAQVVTSNIQLTCAWCDPYMSWNASRYNITELSVGSSYLWTPDVVLVNAADRTYSRNREHYALLLRHDGYIRFMFQDLWKTICKVRSTYFPFDRQHCTIIIRSGSYDTQSMKFVRRRPIQGHPFISGEWELTDAYTHVTDERVSDFGQVNYSLVHFTLILKRNYVYYFIKIILPFTLVSMVTLFTFLLPPQSGEKLTLNVTILLSLVIYLQLISGYIPKSDNETPILTLFCNANFFLVFLSSVMTIYVLYLYHRPTTSTIAYVPSNIKRILLDYLSPLVYCSVNKCVKSHQTSRLNIKGKKLRRLSSIDKRINHLLAAIAPARTPNQRAIELLKLLRGVKAHICTQWFLPFNTHNEYKADDESLKTDNQQRLDEWRHVALVLDRLFFLLFIVAMPCTALLFISARSSVGDSFDLNLTNIKVPRADAQCDLKYTPILI